MFIAYEDLTAFDADIPQGVADALIEDFEAQAALVAPCLANPETVLTELQQRQVKAVLRQAILRRVDAGNAGTRTTITETAGSFSQTQGFESKGSKGLFWPSEITDLQKVCAAVTGAAKGGKAFGVDTVGGTPMGNHLPWCSITWGDWCSCGAYLTRGETPLYEGGLIS